MQVVAAAAAAAASEDRAGRGLHRQATPAAAVMRTTVGTGGGAMAVAEEIRTAVMAAAAAAEIRMAALTTTAEAAGAAETLAVGTGGVKAAAVTTVAAAVEAGLLRRRNLRGAVAVPCRPGGHLLAGKVQEGGNPASLSHRCQECCIRSSSNLCGGWRRAVLPFRQTKAMHTLSVGLLRPTQRNKARRQPDHRQRCLLPLLQQWQHRLQWLCPQRRPRG